MEMLEVKEKTNGLNPAMLKKKLIKIGVILGLIAICVVVIFVMAKKIDNQNQEIADLIARLVEMDDDPAIANQVSPQIVYEIMSSEIKGIGELATVEYLFTNAARFSDSKQIRDWNIPFTEKSFIMRWDGVIKAGIRVDEIEITVDEANKKVIVYIPEAEILSYSVDSENVEILDEKNNMFNKITVEDKVKFDAESEEEMKQRAIENGLLEKAQKSAEEIILKLFSANAAISEQYIIECKTK